MENFSCTHIRVLREIFDKNMLVGSMKFFFGLLQIRFIGKNRNFSKFKAVFLNFTLLNDPNIFLGYVFGFYGQKKVR